MNNTNSTTHGRHVAVAGAILLALALTGCATTQMQTQTHHAGILQTGDRLVKLVVTADLATVRRECGQGVVAPGRVLYGCNTWREVSLPSGATVRTVTIVRYVDALPSHSAFEIAANQTCRMLAALVAAGAQCETGAN